MLSRRWTPAWPALAARAAWGLARAVALLAAATAAATTAAQGKVIGPNECEKCHKPALRKWRVEEAAQLGARAHVNTHKHLADPKSARYAAAIGLSDPLAPGGRCVECHATVLRGSPRNGVSCESCHGPASLWNPVHDKEPLAESYEKSLPLGLRDLHRKPAAIAALCVSCHVTPEPALAAAGHPNGADFDAGAGLRKLVHWTAAFTGDGKEHASYDSAQVSNAARPLVQRALARANAPAPRTSAPGLGAERAAARPPRAAPAPWDWDQAVPTLPEDYPSDADAVVRDLGATVAPPRGPSRALSIAADRPALQPPAVATPAPAAPRAAGPAERSLTDEAAELRGRAALLLAELLETGRRAPDLPEPAAPREFQGPDSELLNIQDVVLYLALQALRERAPAPAGGIVAAAR